MYARLSILTAAALCALTVVACGGRSPTRPSPIGGGNGGTPPAPGPPSPPPSPSPNPAPEPVRPVTLAYTRFMAFGDSLTAGVVSVSTTTLVTMPTLSYPQKLQEALVKAYSQPGITVYNEGKPGEWAEDGRTRFASVVRTLDPEVVLLMEGANDLNALGRAGLRRALSGMESMAKEARFSGARLLIASLPPQRDGTNASSLIREYNDSLRRLAQGEQAIFVDVYAAFAGDLSLIGPDGLHPTPAGYERIAQAFFEQIQRSFEQAQPSRLSPADLTE